MAMKFRAHDTFFIRKGWLNKGMKHVRENGNVFVDKSQNPMDVFGIGSNMVKALRYWLQAVGLTKEPIKGKRTQSFTTLGECIFENDKYVEEMGTLCLLQYKLATNKELATAWYFFFNHFNMAEFTREDFVLALQNYTFMEEENVQVAIRSLNDDFSCIVNSYLSKYKNGSGKVSPENNIDCPFGELGLIDVVDSEKKVYRKTSIMPKLLDPWVALAIIVDQAGGEKEVLLSKLLTDTCNIGKVFNLDSIAMLEVLHNIESMGEIKITRTAGLDVVQINNDYGFQDCVDQYYGTFEIDDEENSCNE